MNPGVGPVRTPGAWLGGFMKGTTKQWYLLIIWALGLIVSEKKIVFKVFSHYKSMGANDPRGVANLGPRGLIGRIYVGDN